MYTSLELLGESYQITDRLSTNVRFGLRRLPTVICLRVVAGFDTVVKEFFFTLSHAQGKYISLYLITLCLQTFYMPGVGTLIRS